MNKKSWLILLSIIVIAKLSICNATPSLKISPLMTPITKPTVQTDSIKPVIQENLNDKARVILQKAPNINPKALKLALKAYQSADKLGVQHQKGILSIIDFSKPDNAKRLWIVDLNRNKILFNTLVAHGVNSGDLYATRFSNAPSSLCSSIGLYLTKNAYQGTFGLSLRLDGLDKGFNDNALKRAVVFHGGTFVSDFLVKQCGKIGRSWGCPTVAQHLAYPIIHTIKNGTLVFAYAPNRSYEAKSRFLL
jgi:hypothetical protein